MSRVGEDIEHELTIIPTGGGLTSSWVSPSRQEQGDEVRETAAEAFDSLQQILGKRAVDQVLPYLLNLLRTEEEADNALAALLTLLTETTRSNIILPNLIPTLTTPPISAFDAKALASLSKVAGAAMNRRLPNIINSLMDNEINCKEEELRTERVVLRKCSSSSSCVLPRCRRPAASICADERCDIYFQSNLTLPRVLETLARLI